MARDQGIVEIKFANKRGMQLPHSNWLAGVDCDNNFFEDEESDDDDEDDDDECQPPTMHSRCQFANRRRR